MMFKRRPPHKAEPHLYVIVTVNKNPIPKVNKMVGYRIVAMKNQTKPKLKFIGKLNKNYIKNKVFLFLNKLIESN